MQIVHAPEDWEMRYDLTYQIPWAFTKTTWLGYDDEISAQEKVRIFSKDKGNALS